MKHLHKIVEDLFEDILVNKQEGVGSSIEGVGHLAVVVLAVDGLVDHGDDHPGEGVEVEDGREGVQADGVELVAVLHYHTLTRIIY